MRIDDDIVRIAVQQIGLAVVGLIGWTGVYISERIPTKWKLRRAGTRLKALETLVRRLITLMALKLNEEPDTTRFAHSPSDSHATAIAPENSGDIGGEIPDMIESISFQTSRHCRFRLLPALMEFSERPDFSSFTNGTASAEIAAKRFTRRIVALQRIVDAPEVHARRLARALHKIRRSGEFKPVVSPVAIPSGLAPEIGILHGGISFELREALRKWSSAPPDEALLHLI